MMLMLLFHGPHNNTSHIIKLFGVYGNLLYLLRRLILLQGLMIKHGRNKTLKTLHGKAKGKNILKENDPTRKSRQNKAIANECIP